VEAEVLDSGALLCLVPGGRALLDAFSAEGETSARVLSPRGFQRRHGVRVQRNTAPIARLRRAVIEPGHFPVEIYAAPFEPQDLTRTTPRRERKLDDRFHVSRQFRDQSIRLLASQEAHAPSRFLQHPDLRHPAEPSPVLMSDVQDPANHLERAIHRRVRCPILECAIANERDELSPSVDSSRELQ
jgi:hypothetical protein